MTEVTYSPKSIRKEENLSLKMPSSTFSYKRWVCKSMSLLLFSPDNFSSNHPLPFVLFFFLFVPFFFSSSSSSSSYSSSSSFSSPSSPFFFFFFFFFFFVFFFFFFVFLFVFSFSFFFLLPFFFFFFFFFSLFAFPLHRQCISSALPISITNSSIRSIHSTIFSFTSIRSWRSNTFTI